MGKYPTTNIVFSGLDDKGGPTVTILDEKKNKWTIWKTDYENKDQDSEAYGSLKNFKIGESFGVEYGEKEESFVVREGKDIGKTINFTRRTIYKILPLVANPSPNPNPPQSVHSGANRGQSGHSNDAFGRRLAIHGFVNGLLASGQTPGQVVSTLPSLINLEDEIDKFLLTPLDGANLDLPVIQQDEDITEGVPF